MAEKARQMAIRMLFSRLARDRWLLRGCNSRTNFRQQLARLLLASLYRPIDIRKRKLPRRWLQFWTNHQCSKRSFAFLEPIGGDRYCLKQDIDRIRQQRLLRRIHYVDRDDDRCT